jgi:hypothetical protein
MNKKAKFTFMGGMNQDVSKSKHSADIYYEGNAIRIINSSSQSMGSIENEKGNSIELLIPTPIVVPNENKIFYSDKSLVYANTPNNELANSTLPLESGDQKIIGHVATTDSILLFTTDDGGFDCIWEISNILAATFTIDLKYCRDLNFSSANPIQGLFNYENDVIQKLYWVDGVNQLRFLNLKHSIDNGDSENLIDLNAAALNIVSGYDISQPVLIDKIGGGNHTAGMIQYAYNLYKLNGSQTTISPLSELISLDKGESSGGGLINEIVGVTPLLKIPTLDLDYSNIRVYAIKYTSYNEAPSISLIVDEVIDSYSNYTFSDSGNSISTLTAAEFVFLGSDPITPKHIESKDNRLLLANYTDSAYQLDVDMRAYSHDSTGKCVLYKGNIGYDTSITGSPDVFPSSKPISEYNYLKTDDAVNPDYNLYKYHKNGSTIGGEGLFIKYTIVNKSINDANLKDYKFFKDDEIYRLGIQFYNKLGQVTDVKWIADFKAPRKNLTKSYNTLRVDIKTTELNNYINSLNLSDNDKPVGYKIVRADRTLSDRTILCQGGISGMMTQTTYRPSERSYWRIKSNRVRQSDFEVKVPIFLTRGFNQILSAEESIRPTKHLEQLTDGRIEGNDEIYQDNDDDYQFQKSWQYTKMMQLYSPEILFNTGISFGSGLELFPKGIYNHKQTDLRVKKIRTNTGEAKYNNSDINATTSHGLIGFKKEGYGIIGPVYDGCRDNYTMHKSFNRDYTKSIDITNNRAEFLSQPILGSPEISERGAGTKNYNNNGALAYTNSLESVISDRYEGGRDDEAIESVNSFNSRCVTMVLGTQDDVLNHKTMESIIPSDVSSKSGILMGEIRRPISYRYNGNLYGGITSEAKTRSTYIEIGEYKSITENFIQIDSPGDTYVQNFNFGRILKTDTQKLSCRVIQLSEIVTFPVETTINLQNRSDISFGGWDSKFQPRYDEYHSYNRVYSQESNLISRQSDSFKFKDVNNFATRIIASKLKIPGENIDSWTDLLQNETMDLDGKYGSINSLANLKDNIYAIQNGAISSISINPRIQTQGSDGISLELGKGSILYDYNYLSTSSGTLDKWSTIISPSSLYYLDATNKALMKFNPNSGLMNISSSKGFHSYFKNNIDYFKISKNDILNGYGAVGGYDIINADMFMTILQGGEDFTIRFNEKSDSFNSFEPYTPSRYINKGDILLTTNPENNSLYRHYAGEYNTFYDEHKPSYITLLVNPEADIDCTFNNVSYKSEAYINNVDQPNTTLTSLKAWNEYQDTGKLNLVLGRNKNLRRKFRDWSAIIGRNKGTRDRIRNPWMFLKLEFDNSNNVKFILHDIIINYTV